MKKGKIKITCDLAPILLRRPRRRIPLGHIPVLFICHLSDDSGHKKIFWSFGPYHFSHDSSGGMFSPASLGEETSSMGN